MNILLKHLIRLAIGMLMANLNKLNTQNLRFNFSRNKQRANLKVYRPYLCNKVCDTGYNTLIYLTTFMQAKYSSSSQIQDGCCKWVNKISFTSPFGLFGDDNSTFSSLLAQWTSNIYPKVFSDFAFSDKLFLIIHN